MPAPEVIERVEKLLGVEHFDEVARARIVELGPDALDVLADCSTDTGPGKRRFMKTRAIVALADWPDAPAALSALDVVLGASDTDDRLRAAMALGEMGSDAAVTRLAAFAVGSQRELDQAAAVRALRTTTAASGREALAGLRASVSPRLQAQIDQSFGD